MGFRSVPKYTQRYAEKYDKKYRDRSNKEVSDSIQLMVASLNKLQVRNKEWLKKVEAMNLPKIEPEYNEGVYYQTYLGVVTDKKSNYSHYLYKRIVRNGVLDRIDIQKVHKQERGLLWVKTLRNAEIPLLLNEELRMGVREGIDRRLKGLDLEIPIIQHLHDEYAITDRKKCRIAQTYQEYKVLMEQIFERSYPGEIKHLDDMSITTMTIDKFQYSFIGNTLVYPKSIKKIKAVPK